MYNNIREVARGLGYRISSMNTGQHISSIRFNANEVILGVNELGKEQGDRLNTELNRALGL